MLVTAEDLGDDSLDAPFEKVPDGAKEAARAGSARDAEGAQKARRDPRRTWRTACPLWRRARRGGAATARVPRQQQAGLGVLFDHDPWPVSADALTELAYALAGVGCRPWQWSGSGATRHGGMGGGCGAARPLQLRLQPMTARWDPMRPLRHYHLLLRATAPGRHSICFSDPPAIVDQPNSVDRCSSRLGSLVLPRHVCSCQSVSRPRRTFS